MKPALFLPLLLVACGGEPAPAEPTPPAPPEPAIEAAPPEPPAEPADPPIAPPRVLAMGTSFVCVVREGRVLCAGEAPSARSRGGLAPIAGLEDVVEIDAEGGTLCARRSTGTVWCAHFDRPPFEVDVHDAVRIRFDMLLLVQHADGTLHQFSFADDERPGRPVPAVVEGTPPARLDATADLIADFGKACALGAHGSVTCSADNDPEVHTYVERGAREIALDNGWLEVALADGTVHTDMLNDTRYTLVPRPELDHLTRLRGPCGLRDGGAVCPTIDDRRWRALPEGRVEGHPFVEVAREPDAVCAIDAERSLYCWGAPPGGIVEGLDHTPQPPVAVVDLGDATAVTVGDDHVCALRAGGAVACWGEGFGARPRDVPLGDPSLAVTELASTGLATCARSSDGRVTCWGRRAELDVFGIGGPPRPLAPVSIAAEAEQLVASGERVCVRRRSGEVACWTPGDDAPHPVTALHGATTIAGGGGFVCGVITGALRCTWLVDGLSMPGELPVPPIEVGSIDELRAGGDAACVRRGERWECVGHNGVGQLGRRPSRPLSELVPFPGGVAALSLAHHRTCGVGEGGAVRCAGVGRDGEPRPESMRGTGALVTLPGVTGARAVALGVDLACAVTSEGRVFCWGDGFEGGLGDGRSAILDAPTLVPLSP